MRTIKNALLCSASAIFLTYYSAQADQLPDVLERPAEIQAHVERAVFLSIARAGERLVAVGEKGMVAVSDDNGRSWRQTAVPVSVTLTVVRFVSASQGWAAGHGGVILHTTDGGLSWTLQMDGIRAAKMMQDAAQAAGNQSLIKAAQQLVADGADKPFLDLSFTDDQHGFAVGAYDLFFETGDGGAHWVPVADRLDNPKGLHLYALLVQGDDVTVGGEQGVLFRSHDGGKTFARIETGARATVFLLASLPGGDVLAGGLKGNAFRIDASDKVQAVAAAPMPSSFNRSLTVGADGNLICVNQAGRILMSRDGGQTFQILADPPGPPVIATALAGDNTLIAAGFGGVGRLGGAK